VVAISETLSRLQKLMFVVTLAKRDFFLQKANNMDCGEAK
jgi:hypothetical protein